MEGTEKIVPMEQQNKEWKVLKEITKLINEEPSFVKYLQEYFDKDKSVDEIIEKMNDWFGE